MCQDLAKHCLGTGQAFSITSSFSNGISFSTPGFNLFPRNTRAWTRPFLKKTKTPSTLRRDRRRWDEFQEKQTKPAAETPREQPSSKETPTAEPSIVVAEAPATPRPVVDSLPPTESTPSSLEKDSHLMEVDVPPAMISPISSPTLQPAHPKTILNQLNQLIPRPIQPLHSKTLNHAQPPPSKNQTPAQPPPSKNLTPARPPQSKNQTPAQPHPSKNQTPAQPPPSKSKNVAQPPPSKDQNFTQQLHLKNQSPAQLLHSKNLPPVQPLHSKNRHSAQPNHSKTQHHVQALQTKTQQTKNSKKKKTNFEVPTPPEDDGWNSWYSS